MYIIQAVKLIGIIFQFSKAMIHCKLAYKNRKNAGTATVTITGIGKYGSSVRKTFTIKKAANPMTVTTKSLTANASTKTTIKKSKAFNVSREKGKVMNTIQLDKENHLYLLWANADPVTSENMVLMYATNSLLHGWWEKVTVIVWGGSQKTLLDNNSVRLKFQLAKQVGVKFSACIACAVNQGLKERLEQEEIEVIPWGELLTELIKEGYHFLSV